MADKLLFKMFLFVFLFFLISDSSFSLAVSNKDEKCGCYSICNKNFTLNTVQDVEKISACQRGCRFFSLVLHTSHMPDQGHDLKKAKKNCLLSCSESYISPVEMSACQFGCAAVEMSRILCNTVEIQTPQMTYSFVIEESDILIHPGEPEPDDALMDPGLRKQIQKTLAALLDATPKIPEIRFTNLPVKTEKSAEASHGVLKCPKLYGFDSRLEFRNGKIIIGDLYLFLGIFIFVVVCYLLGHYFETKSLTKHLQKMKMQKKNELAEIEPLIQVEIEKSEELFCNEMIPSKPEILDSGENSPDEKFESITLVFHDEKSVTKEGEEEEGDVSRSLKI